MIDRSKFLPLFVEEAREHLAALEGGLSALEAGATAPLVQELFRHAHSLKGMAASMGFQPIRDLAHGMEEALDRIRSGDMAPTAALVGALGGGIDGITAMVEAAGSGSEELPAASPWIAAIRAALAARLHRGEEAPVGRLSIQIVFLPEAPMRTARAAVVLRRLARVGRLIGSVPGFDDLAALAARGPDAFDGRIQAILETALSAGRLKDELERIPEIGTAIVIALPAGHAEPAGHAVPPPEAEAASASGPGPDTSSPTAPAPTPQPGVAAPALRVASDALDRFLDEVGELVVLRGRMNRLIEPLGEPATAREVERLRKISERLFREVMGMRLIPFDSVAHRFHASVRDLSRELGRPMALHVTGGEVPLDRAMLDGLADPINHMLRNCAGHGIEDPPERTCLGKPATGTISIDLARSAQGLRIRIADDGRGMDPARIRRHALERRFITRERFETIGDDEALLLTTIPGFSTADRVTDLSGRGVGMDVVRTAVESLGGRLRIRSRQGQGTTFELALPLTTAIIPAFLVVSAGRTWAVPLSSVRRTLDLAPGETDARGRLQSPGESAVEIFDLARLIGGLTEPGAILPGNSGPVLAEGDGQTGEAETGEPARRTALLIAADSGAGQDERIVGILVESIVAQQDIVVKPLGPPLDELRAYTGATVLEDGRIALILDLANLVPAGAGERVS